jgi:hypothetical protein
VPTAGSPKAESQWSEPIVTLPTEGESAPSTSITAFENPLAENSCTELSIPREPVCRE